MDQNRKIRAAKLKRQAALAEFADQVTAGIQGRTAANVWNLTDNSNAANKKASSNPGLDAVSYVSEILSEYKIAGTFSARPTRSERRAGKGSHGITEGSITVEVEFKPGHGTSQVVEIPVQIKNGYLQRPGVMVLEGQPFVIAQSAIDELFDQASFGDPPQGSRRHIYSIPTIEPKRAELRLRAEVVVPDDDALLSLKAGTRVSMVGEDDESIHLQAHTESDNAILFSVAREHIPLIVD